VLRTGEAQAAGCPSNATNGTWSASSTGRRGVAQSLHHHRCKAGTLQQARWWAAVVGQAVCIFPGGWRVALAPRSPRSGTSASSKVRLGSARLEAAPPTLPTVLASAPGTVRTGFVLCQGAPPTQQHGDSAVDMEARSGSCVCIRAAASPPAQKRGFYAKHGGSGLCRAPGCSANARSGVAEL
jgi:hypothetical protein